MFTGIIEEIGEVVSVAGHGDAAMLTVRAHTVAADLTRGASIAVSGVCLTVTGWTPREPGAGGGVRREAGSESWGPGEPGCEIDFDVMAETLKRSGIGALRPGDRVNLERAVRVDSRLGGHVVQGHVDGTGVVLSRTPGDGWEAVRFAVPAGLSRYLAEKGSVAVDGVSLTVSAAGPDWFEVGLIPETLRATTLGARQPGDSVNLEVDVLAKYVARLLEVPR